MQHDWGRDTMDAISQTIFSNAFSWMKMYEFRLEFHWSLFLRVQLTIFQHWFRWWLGAVQATSHYMNQWWSNQLTHICVTRPQWVDGSSVMMFHNHDVNRDVEKEGLWLHWGLNKMDTFCRQHLHVHFLSRKIIVFCLQFHWSYVFLILTHWHHI